MNRAIEFHDSKIEKILQEGNDVRVIFAEAYIHQSKGKPGVDAGTGWTQKAELFLKDADVKGRFPEFPAGLWDGHIIIDQRRSMLLIPLDLKVTTETSLVFFSGETVDIKSESASLALIGEPTFVENFRGNSEL